MKTIVFKDFVFEEIINAMLLFAVIGTFTYGGTYYYDYVIPFVTGAGDDISSRFIGGEGSSVTVLETIFKAYDDPIDKLYNELAEASLWKDKVATILSYCVGCIFLWLSKIIFTLMIVVNLLISKVMVSLLLSVGIIFFCFAIFPSTRNLFTAFVGSALNYIFLNIMYCVSARLSAHVVNSIILKLGHPGDFNLDLNKLTTKELEKLATEMVANSCVIFLSTIIIVLAINQIPSLVSTLTGGVSISPVKYSDIINKGKDIANSFKGTPRAGGGSINRGSKTSGGAGNAWNKLRGNFIKGA